jgi:hypothetical protein
MSFIVFVAVSQNNKNELTEIFFVGINILFMDYLLLSANRDIHYQKIFSNKVKDICMILRIL